MPEHRHNNSSLTRAIRSRTGLTEYQHLPYSLVPYDANIYGYGVWFDPRTWGDEEEESTTADDDKANGGKVSWKTSLISGAGELLGDVGGSWIQGKYGKQVADAQIESNERIAMAQMQANKQAQAAQNAGGGDAAGMGTGTKVVLSLSVLAFLGGTGYYFYSRRS
jgi:hypothetical protein